MVTADLLEAHAAAEIGQGRPAPDETALRALRSAVLARVLGLGGLQALMDDPDIETINANGCDVVFAIRADGTTTDRGPDRRRPTRPWSS
jgi:pilus assembly protein CpaF